MNATTQPDVITIFRPYGITDGRILVSELQDNLERRTKISTTCEDAQTIALRNLAHGFRAVYVNTVEVPIIPDALDRAIDEAATSTIHTYLGEDVCIDTDVIPTFHRYVVSFFRSFIKFGVDAIAGLEIDSSTNEKA